MTLEKIRKKLHKKSNKNKAKILQRFFKTGKGEYGEGDVFLGVTIPRIREITKKFEINMKEIRELLKSKVHEERMLGTLFLVKEYEKTKKEKNEKEMKRIFEFYLKNIKSFNNWDLIDLSAPKIIGDYLLENKNERKILYELSNLNKGKGFEDLWKKRIAIVSTWTFIRNNEFKDTIKIAKKYLKEEHDLLHKATGWMLREVGKKNKKILLDFLDKYYREMPRTMLRYAIERLDKNKKEYYMKK
jgi:3-methyladenine DNA glycosylase AlkD